MYKLVAFIFFLFAAVQYNDPDAFIWMPAYLLVSILVILWGLGKSVRLPLLIAAILYSIWMLTYIPDVLAWIQEGLPSITGSMQAESPFTEFVREFFGLAICLGTCLFYARK